MSGIKTFTLFAGCNGAGKSTLYSSLKDTKKDFGVRLNSDEIVSELKEDWKDQAIQIKAGRKLLEFQSECFDKELSFNRESTLSGTTIISHIKKAKELGYIITLYYVGVSSTDIAKERVRQRIAKGGHGVTDEVLERRYDKSLENFVEVFRLCDEVFIYDNSTNLKQLCKYSEGVLFANDNYEWMRDKKYSWAMQLLDKVEVDYSPALSELVKSLPNICTKASKSENSNEKE